MSTLDSVRREATRSLFRAKNGIRYITGVGGPKVGQTPSDVVWRRGKARLLHYRGKGRSRRQPLVIVFSIVSRAYILDLRPGRSFVEQLLQRGLDVFLLDWGEADAVDSTNTLETYTQNYLPRALDAAREHAGRDGVDVLGYCFGGTLSVLGVAGQPHSPVRHLAVMATPIDFKRLEGVVRALDRGSLHVDDLVDHTGNVPAEAVYRAFASLRPTADVFKYADIWERLWSDEFMDNYQSMGQWLRDQVPFPGETARQVTDLLLRRNLLASGTVPLGGRPVRLADIRCPVLNVIAANDHMVPPVASEVLNNLVGSDDVTELRVPAGHVGLVTGRSAVQTTIPGIVDWLQERNA
ncbi:MAG: alpha/beta fold hydrolase [Thermoleophilaceae bacterium]